MLCIFGQNIWKRNILSQAKTGKSNIRKDLGVMISSNFKVLKQCIKAAKKGNQILRIISRNIICRKE